MKKIISLILCFALMLCLVPQVSAKRYNYVSVKLDAGSGASTETAIVQGSELYLPAKSYSEITRYTYYEDNLLYLIDGQSQDKAFKTIKVNTKNNTLLISSVKVIDLPDTIESDGQLYLPLSIMLPVLNADVATIIDGVIYISNNELSLGEILYDFNISDYTFDYASEFADNIWLGKLSYELPNYLLDSVTHFRLDRLDIIFKSGNYNDYLDIFTDYLLDDEIYLESMSESDPNLSGLLEIINSTQSINKNFKTVFEWGEEFKNNYFESAKDVFNYLDAYIPYAYNLEDVVDAVNAGDFSIMDALEVVEFFFNYYYQVEDHREMLDTVYHVDNKVAWNDAERKAARQIYNIYGGNAAEGLLRGVWDKLCESAVGIATTPIKMYELTSKVSGTVLQAVLPHDAMQNAAEISKLSLYETAMYSARSNYYEYKDNLNTDNDANNLRHSILMTLLSSRSCYKVMLNTAKGYQDSLLATDYSSLISYYEHEINKINALMCLLYKVADNVEYDSYEHIQTLAKEIRQKIADSKIADKETDSVQQGNTDNPTIEEKPGQTTNSDLKIDVVGPLPILRNENFSKVIPLDELKDSEKKVFGFYESVLSKRNSTEHIFYDNHLFIVTKNDEYDLYLKRISSKGSIETLEIAQEIITLPTEPRALGAHNNKLYLMYTVKESAEFSFVIARIDNPSSSNWCSKEIVRIPFAENFQIHENSFIQLGKHIYYSAYSKEHHGHYLYRLDVLSLETERLCNVAEETDQIVPRNEDSFIFYTGIPGDWNAWLIDLKTYRVDKLDDEITLGSEIDYSNHWFGEVKGDYFYYLKDDYDMNLVSIMRMDLNNYNSERLLSIVPQPGDHFYVGVYENFVLLYSWVFVDSDQKLDYVDIHYCNPNIELPAGSMRIDSMDSYTLSGFEDNGTFFLVLLDQILYTDINQCNRWQEIKVNGPGFLHRVADALYLISVTSKVSTDNDWEYIFTSTKLDFQKQDTGNTSDDKKDINYFLKMTSPEIKEQVFSSSYNVYYWFTGARFAGATSENQKIVVEGKPYYKIIDGKYTKYDDMMSYAKKYFSEKALESFITKGSVLNVDGDLYQFNPGYGGAYDPGYPIDYKIEHYTDRRIVYSRCSKYPKDPWTDKTPEQMTDEDYNTFYSYYVLELINDCWVFTDWELDKKP